MRTLAIAFTACIILMTHAWAAQSAWVSSTPDQVEQIKKALVEHSYLKDPFSAELRKARASERIHARTGDEMTWYCAEINSANSYGAMSGWRVMWAARNSGTGDWVFSVGRYGSRAKMQAAQKTNPRSVGSDDIAVALACDGSGL